VRRNFFKLAELDAPVAVEAVQRIDPIFDIERTIMVYPSNSGVAVRQEQMGAPWRTLHGWMRSVRCKMSRRGDVA
jgi:transposase